jgi:membrane-associated phospholipid phosphatase
VVSALEPLARRCADRLGDRSPTVSVIVMLVGWYVTLVTATAGAGLVLVHVVVADERGRWDLIGVNQWFSERFTPTVDTWSAVASRLADTTTVIAIVVVVSVGFLVVHRWQYALLVSSALTLEVSVFLTMTVLVARDRPVVPKPDEVPPTSSYPSGHTAAGTALYLSIALLVAAQLRNRAARILVLVAGLLPGVLVAIARIARGMHHPTDVIVGYLLGLVCVLAAIVTVMVAEQVAGRRAVGGTAQPGLTR